MSVPDPATVNTPLLQLSLPAFPLLPTTPANPKSCAAHGDGTLAVGVALTAVEFVLWPAPFSAFTT